MNVKIANITDKIRLVFKKEKEPYLRIFSILGFYPHDISIYEDACRHRSCSNTRRKRNQISNERLEFLGDAVLESVVSDILYNRYEDKQEGYLTTLRSKLVKRETLNDLAVKIGLDKLVIHSDFVHNSHNSYMNGNAFEAFLGAIYIDRGYDYCMYFIKERIFGKYISIDQVAQKEENYKSKLIEWCQKYQFVFEFIIANEAMESGNTPKFQAVVKVEGQVCGKGTGYTKKESHQSAAKMAYAKVCSNVGFVNKLFELKRARQNAPEAEPKDAQ